MDTNKRFDLEQRTFEFARQVRLFLSAVGEKIAVDDKRQLLRSSASVGANYIEANEAISPRDFLLRIRISRKEAKESYFWLGLAKDTVDRVHVGRLEFLRDEALQLAKIFSTIAKRTAEKVGPDN